MSWAIANKCYGCTKRDKCIDRHVLEGAIYAIHCAGGDNGHLGAGDLEMECVNFEEEKEEVKGDD